MIGTTTVILLGLLALSLPVAAVLGILGVVLTETYGFLPLTRAIGEISWTVSNEFVLVAIPLYILMGEVLLRSGIAERMYAAMRLWLSWLPGGLMHSNIGFCTVFAATSGSSVATAATVGTVSLGEMKKRGYNERLFLGSLAAGGTLGILIPPSINLIVYGVLTETSIPQLYLAGFIPGLILALLYMATIAGCCLVKPEWGGEPTHATWDERIASLADLWPPLVIFLVVIGSIYSGLATPSESAALGLLASLALAAYRRRLSIDMLRHSIEGAMRTSAMSMAILLGAYFLNFVIGSIGLSNQVNEIITTLGLSPFDTLMMVVLFYLVLGMFMETLSMMVATVPIITPVIMAAGYDPVWFGILIMLLMETAMITPPVGINLFVVQGVRGGGHLSDVMIGAAPFVLTLLLMIALLIALPDMAMFLPELMHR
jgi:C4-dicarboxylate transporter, DctM subunit